MRLWVLDPTGATPPTSTPLAYTFWALQPAADGSVLYALAFGLDPTERSWVAVDPTFLVVLDAVTGTERSRIVLPGVKFAQRKETDAQGMTEYWSYSPGLVFSPDGVRAYVAHADEPLVDVVDLTAGRIERTVRTDAPARALEHLLDLFARPVAAKGGVGLSALLAVSPDGQRLYTRLFPDDRAAGLLAVDTRTWDVRHFDPTATGVRLSADGKW
jgi:DNA-binding beta-propeller fold protein YncE